MSSGLHALLDYMRSEDGRRWVYRVAIAVLGLLAVHGFVQGDQVAAWAALAGALTNAQAYRHVGLKGVNPPPPNVSRETSTAE